MGFIDKTLGKLFGNKSDRDLKELAPYLEVIKKEYDRIKQLDTNGLRAESQLLKDKIQDYIKAEKDEIQALKDKVESGELSVNQKEETYDKIDEIEKTIDDRIEEVLNQILPAAFCIVKETARRFTENEEIEVTATQFDRDLAARADHVQIEGDNAVWFNSWDAGGTRSYGIWFTTMFS